MSSSFVVETKESRCESRENSKSPTRRARFLQLSDSFLVSSTPPNIARDLSRLESPSKNRRKRLRKSRETGASHCSIFQIDSPQFFAPLFSSSIEIEKRYLPCLSGNRHSYWISNWSGLVNGAGLSSTLTDVTLIADMAERAWGVIETKRRKGRRRNRFSRFQCFCFAFVVFSFDVECKGPRSKHQARASDFFSRPQNGTRCA